MLKKCLCSFLEMNWEQKEWKERRKNTSTSCELRSILGCSCHLCGSPRLPARSWPLARLFDGWLYDTILVRSVTEGQAARAQAVRPFSGYFFTAQDVRTSLVNPHGHVEHACGGGGFINTYNLFYTGLISLFSITAVTQIKIIITFLLFCINNNNELVCHCDHLRVWEQRFIQKDEKYLMKTCLNPNLNKPKLLYII